MQIVGGVVKFMQNVAKCEMAHSEFNGHQNVVDKTPAPPLHLHLLYYRPTMQISE